MWKVNVVIESQKVAPDAKSCSNVAEQNRDRPNDDDKTKFRLVSY